MSENKIELKDIYDDAILSGTVEGAEITKRCGAKERADGGTELMLRYQACCSADRLAEKLGSLSKVAYAVTSILYTATILYGKLGEEFLRTKLQENGEDFSLEEYCNAVAESVIRAYNGSRKQEVLEAVKAAMSDTVSVEANAAKASIMKYEYWNEKRFEEGLAIEEAYLKGEMCEYKIVYEKMIRDKYGEINEAAAIENLNIAYNYLKANMSKITPVYSEIFPGVSEEKLLAYYISRLSVEEVERVKALAFCQD